eukprot:TRINITY_DN20355_c0_g2_i1.p1 TRINITY_DN20355_c0_g2~~TRINITY_DN20355_c0_g2_i1.p1  ORF type:complete len:518 (+),score=55.33 TRINITY_DN20355_c0_g2_i1:185-1738(+)
MGGQAVDAEQLHVSVTGEKQLTVSWASPSGVLGSLEVEELEDDRKNALAGSRRILKASSTRYLLQNSDGKGGAAGLPGIYTSPLLLHADVPVQPRHSYRYRVVANATGGSTAAGTWRTIRAPPAADGSASLRVAMVGDLGQTNFSAATCSSLARAHAARTLDVAILLGDLAYADGNQSRWDSFGVNFEEAGCADVPWLVIPGNHDIDHDALTGQAFLPYRNRWRAPQIAEEVVADDFKVHDWATYDMQGHYDFGGSFYSIRLGCVHFIALNPYTESHNHSAQIAWLRSELAHIDRYRLPYLVALTHSPWVHSSARHGASYELATARLRASAEPLLKRAGVSMLFAGHVHAYERSYPVDGMHHFVVGHGGNYERLYDEWDVSPHSAFHAGDHYGWGELQLEPEAFAWLAHRSVDDVIVDTLVAARPVPPPLHFTHHNRTSGLAAMELLLAVAISGGILLLCLMVCCVKLLRPYFPGFFATAEERKGFTADPEGAVVGCGDECEEASPPGFSEVVGKRL